MEFKTLKVFRIFIILLMTTTIMISCKEQENKKAENMVTDTIVQKTPFFKLSLAQWSLHKAMRDDKTIDPLDFAQKASEYGFGGVEYVSQLYTEHIKTMGMDSVLTILKANSEKFNIQSVLIMVDGEGSLASTNDEERNPFPLF